MLFERCIEPPQTEIALVAGWSRYGAERTPQIGKLVECELGDNYECGRLDFEFGFAIEHFFRQHLS